MAKRCSYVRYVHVYAHVHVRVRQHASGLVDHQEMRILVDDAQACRQLGRDLLSLLKQLDFQQPRLQDDWRPGLLRLGTFLAY